LTPAEESLARKHYREEIGTDEFVAEVDDPASDHDFAVGTHTGAGGTVTTYLRLEGVARKRIGQSLITGDFFVAPPRVVFDLEAALRGAYVAEADEIIERFFRERPINALSVTAADFRASLDGALAAARAQRP
jgi:lipoate-protein ligase A